ncbi:MAG TPA: hypothetical protein VEW93_15595 [Acidimicrobiales bacterium]|nr:hypothetical protein [Acidimicrobiales bacterium]
MAAPVTAPSVRPSGWWYALPVLGLVLAGLVGVEILRDGWRDAQQVFLRANVVAPGEDQTITIDEPGGYTIGYVGEAVLGGDADKERFAEELAIEVLPADGAAPLALVPYEGFQELPSPEDQTQYVPLRTVHFAEEGDYVLRSRPQPELDPERTLLVVTQSPYRKIAAAGRTAGLLAVVAPFLAVLVTVILARARGRAKRAARAAPPPPGPWGAWPPPGVR